MLLKLVEAMLDLALHVDRAVEALGSVNLLHQLRKSVLGILFNVDWFPKDFITSVFFDDFSAIPSK